MRQFGISMQWILAALILCIGAGSMSAQSWTQVTAPSAGDCYGGAFADSLNGVVATIVLGESGLTTEIYRTSDGGASWSPAYSVPAAIFGVVYAAPAKAFAVGNDPGCSCGALYASADGGSSWSLGKTFAQATPSLWSIDFIDASTGFVGGDGGTLMKTTDGGATWTPLTINTSGIIRSIQFVDAQHGYVVAARADNALMGEKVFKTTDGGTTWSEMAIPAMTPMVVHFITPQIGFVGGSSGGPAIMKTIDGGATWKKVTFGGDNTSYILSLQFTTPYVGYASGGRPSPGAGTYGFIIETTDGGEMWEQNATRSTTIRSLHFPEETTGYAFGDGGVVLQTKRAVTQDPRPGFTLDQQKLEFGEVGMGDREGLSITIESSSIVPLEITSIHLADTTNGSGFSFTTSVPLPKTLPQYGSLSVDVTFAPAMLGEVSGKLVITSNADGAETVSIPLSGKGVPTPQPAAIVSHDSIRLGNVPVGLSTGTTVEVRAANVSGLIIDSVYLAGSAIDYLSITMAGQLPVTLRKNEEAYITIAFNPLAEGDVSGALVIESNDAAAPRREIPIVARGGSISSVPSAETGRAGIEAAIEPNPACGNAVLRLDLARGGSLRVELFDERGERVMALPERAMEEGEHEIAIDAARLPAGLYHCRVLIGDAVAVRRLVVVR